MLETISLLTRILPGSLCSVQKPLPQPGTLIIAFMTPLAGPRLSMREPTKL
jgi:hypothetical protein